MNTDVEVARDHSRCVTVAYVKYGAARKCFDRAGEGWVEIGTVGWGKEHICAAAAANSLRDWEGGLAHWSFQHAADDQGALCLVQGRPKPQIGEELSHGCLQLPRRDKTTYEDYARHYFIFDIDEFEPGGGFDMRTADRHEVELAVERFVERYFPEARDHSFVVSPTNSAGVKDTKTLRVRLIFETTAPLLLSQQKSVVAEINRRAGAKVADPSIYDPARIIVTAAPLLWENRVGRTQARRPIACPPAWFVEREHDALSVDTLLSVRKGKVNGATRPGASAASVLTRADARALLESLGPGNFHTPILKLRGHYAAATPSHRQGVQFEMLYDAIKREVCARPEPGELERRLSKHCDRDAWQRDWQTTRREVRYKWPINEAPQLAAVDLAVAREDLVQRMKATAAQILGGPPINELFLDAPGIGKSHALQGVFTAEFVTAKRGHVLVPTIALAEQLAAGLKAGLPSEFHSRIVVRKGRRQPGMCINAKHGELAKAVEDIGQSPRKSVCSRCPSHGECPWLAQDGNLGQPGVIIEAHANIATRLKELKEENVADLYVIDESPLSALQFKRELDVRDLHKLVVVKRRRKRGEAGELQLRESITRNLNSDRKQLAEALEGASGVVPTEALMLLEVPAEWRTWPKGLELGRTERGDVSDRMLFLENEHRAALRSEIDAAVEAGDMRLVTALARQHSNSQAITALLEAIQASQRAQRAEVAGVRIAKGRVAVVGFHRLPQAITKQRGCLWLDGTGNETVWRAVLGEGAARRVSGDRPVKPGAYHLTQYVDRPFSKRMLAYDATYDDDGGDDLKAAEQHMAAARALPWSAERMREEEAAARSCSRSAAKRRDVAERKKRADANISRLWRFACVKGFEHQRLNREHGCRAPGGRKIDVLVIVQKGVEALLTQFVLPPNVDVRHFGALRGLNHYREVPCAIIAGRPAVSGDELELLTEALHRHDKDFGGVARVAAQIVDGKPRRLMPKGKRQIRLADCLAAEIDCEQHPDARCEAQRASISDAEAKQALARVRVYDRTNTNPVEIHLFGQCDAGLPVHRLQIWQDADYAWDEVAFAYGVQFMELADNQQAYRGLVPRGRNGTHEANAEGWARACYRARVESPLPPIRIEEQRNSLPLGDKGDSSTHSAAYAPIADNASIYGNTAYAAYRVARFKLESAGAHAPWRHAIIDAAKFPDGKAAIERLLHQQVVEFRWLTLEELSVVNEHSSQASDAVIAAWLKFMSTPISELCGDAVAEIDDLDAAAMAAETHGPPMFRSLNTPHGPPNL